MASPEPQPFPEPAPADAALVVDGLVRRFGSLRAVDGLSMTLPRGNLVALLGPNGAGKTSTLDVCTGFARPDSGTVRVLGLDPWKQSRSLRPRIGVMLQAGGAHAAARVGEMLTVIARCSARPLDPKWLLDTLGLSDAARTPVRRLSGGQLQRLSLAMALVGRPELLFLDEPTAGMDPQARHLVWELLRSVRRLSGGQLQRLSLAMALVGRPELLFLDEPTAGMDPQARHLVWELLRSVRRDGVSVLLTTHLLDEAELLADRVVIIDHGRVVAEGAPAELTGNAPAQLRFTAIAGLDVDLLCSALPHGYSAREVSPGRYLVEGDIAPATVATVTSFCARVGVMPFDVQVGHRTLDEVYLELTGREIR